MDADVKLLVNQAADAAFKEGVQRLFSVLHAKHISGFVNDADRAAAGLGYAALLAARQDLLSAVGAA